MNAPALVQSAILFPEIDPVLISIGPLAIRWYSLAYIAGILLAWYFAKKIVTNPELWGKRQAPTVADLDDFLFWAIIGIIAGGRLGYVIFYNPAYFLSNPGDIIAVWQGGMSFHGGLLGVAVAMYYFAKSRGLPLWSLVDVVSAVAPVGFFLGRIANFINAELWGRPTDVAWGVIFPNGGPIARHPSQLYEAALEGLLLFFVLRIAIYVHGAMKSPSLITGMFVAGYGLGRTLVEFFREPDADIGYLAGTSWLTMGIILSVPMIIIGAYLIITARRANAAT